MSPCAQPSGFYVGILNLILLIYSFQRGDGSDLELFLGFLEGSIRLLHALLHLAHLDLVARRRPRVRECLQTKVFSNCFWSNEMYYTNAFLVLVSPNDVVMLFISNSSIVFRRLNLS